MTEYMYTATTNVPGYLPTDPDETTFETAQEAWESIADTLRDEESDLAETWQGSSTLNTIECLARGEWESQFGWPDGSGTVYGPTPGYDGDHDLGRAYSVVATALPEEPTTEEYAVFGRHVAAMFGSAEEWNSDYLEGVGSLARQFLPVDVGDQDPEELEMWRRLAVKLRLI